MKRILIGMGLLLAADHRIVVMEGCHIGAPMPERMAAEKGWDISRFTPRRESSGWIRGEQLRANGHDHTGTAAEMERATTSLARSGFLTSPRVLRMRRSRPWRLASARIRRCSRWCTRFFSAFSPVASPHEAANLACVVQLADPTVVAWATRLALRIEGLLREE